MNSRPKWEKEQWTTRSVSDDIACKTCKFKLSSVIIRGVTHERHTFGNCKIYDGTSIKPHKILWEHSECKYYKKED